MDRLAALDAAKRAVADRPNSYGNPEDNFERIANLWKAHLQNAFMFSNQLQAMDVAIMLALVKIARLEADPKHADSWIDMAGYAGCGAEVSGAGVDDRPAQNSDLVDDVLQHARNRRDVNAAAAALSLPPGWRFGGPPETKFGFTVGETVNLKTDSVGYQPGVVTGFDAECVLVRWPSVRGFLNGSVALGPQSLRHGA